MRPDEYLHEFLASSIKHLLKNPGKFLNKIENGDINAIKMILDFIHKSIPKPLVDSKKNYSDIYEDLQYEEAFKMLKEDYIDKNN